MHELGIVLEVIDIVRERTNDARISRVSLVIGKLSAVLPDAIRFAWDIAIEGTPLEGATLIVVEKDGLARCRACDRRIVLTRPVGQCECGGFDLEWLEGEELHIQEIDRLIEEGERV